MTARKVFRCIVDDTVLINNVSEVKKWVLNGSITLVVPVYTLERLALLKQDTSQIGINARQTVEFLDRVTEGIDGLPVSSISLQGPTQQYQDWSEVEKHIIAEESEAGNEMSRSVASVVDHSPAENPSTNKVAVGGQHTSGTTNVLSQLLLNKLNFAKEADVTPPTSPSSSNEPSVKNSPDVIAAKPMQESVIIPHSLKSLVNAVVWLSNNNGSAHAITPASELCFVSNSADAASLMRSFGVNTKNVHQLRLAISVEDQELKNQSKYLRTHPPSAPAVSVSDVEPKAMFRYEEDSDEEQVVFKPRGRGSGSVTTQSASVSPVIRGASLAMARPSSSHRHSPRTAHSHPNRAELVKPEIPTEEIDPDSFDRGSFGRANGQRLTLNDGTMLNGHQHRVPAHRSGFPPPSAYRGFYRGSTRGADRGSMRGRGRLFVP